MIIKIQNIFLSQQRREFCILSIKHIFNTYHSNLFVPDKKNHSFKYDRKTNVIYYNNMKCTRNLTLYHTSRMFTNNIVHT